MKKLKIVAIIGAALAVCDMIAGCQTAHIETAEWKATVNSHWFRRDVDRLTIRRMTDGGYDIALNGYKGDTSEQLPIFTREMLTGIVALARLLPMAQGGGGVDYGATRTVAADSSAASPAASPAPSQGTCSDGTCPVASANQ